MSCHTGVSGSPSPQDDRIRYANRSYVTPIQTALSRTDGMVTSSSSSSSLETFLSTFSPTGTAHGHSSHDILPERQWINGVLPPGTPSTSSEGHAQRDEPNPAHTLYVSVQIDPTFCGQFVSGALNDLTDDPYVDTDEHHRSIDKQHSPPRPTSHARRNIRRTSPIPEVSNPSLRLPLEVYEIIIDIVAEDSSTHRLCNLLACALTCRAWLPRSQLHLVMAQRTISGPKSLSSYVHTLHTHPELAERVSSVEIQARRQPLDDSPDWIDVVPEQLAPCLPQLDRIAVTGDFQGKLTAHTTFSRSLSLFNAATGLDLSRAMRLGTPDFITGMARSLPNLHKLHIGGHAVDQELQVQGTTDSTTLDLSHLKISDISVLSLSMTQLLVVPGSSSMSKLTTLEVTGLRLPESSDLFDHLSRSIATCSGLQKLSLGFSLSSTFELGS